LEERGVSSVLVTTSEGELIGAFYRDDVLPPKKAVQHLTSDLRRIRAGAA
jgi:hypothetical protein